MKRLPIPTIPSLPLAFLALGLAGTAAVAASLRAYRLRDERAVATETITVPTILRAHGGDGAVRYLPIADDPFFPGRTPPATRYRLADATAPIEVRPDEWHTLVVLGTVVGADGSSFAICALNGEAPKTVRLGGSIGGYRAEEIGRGRVVFVTPTGERLAVASGQAANAPKKNQAGREWLARQWRQSIENDPDVAPPSGDDATNLDDQD